MESWHPAATFAFFVAALVLTAVVQHPAFQVAAWGAALGLALTVCGRLAWRTVGLLVPVFAAVTLVNPLVNSQGATVLFLLPWGRPYTLEALLFGAQAAAMLTAMLLWFSSFNAVMTGGKLASLFGAVLPGTSLVLTMVLRLVPRFQRRARKVALAFDGLGAGVGQGSFPERVRRGGQQLSALTTWALEGSIATADSMRARGYGTGRRTRLVSYRMSPGLAVGCALEGALLLVAAAGIARGAAGVQFVPTVSFPPADGLFFASLVSFTLFLALPALVNGAERLRWRLSLSRI